MSLPKRSDQIRRAYEDMMALMYEHADTATGGYMVNDAAAARGIKGVDIYWPLAGRAHESAASNELREAWDHGLCVRPMSFADFRRINYPAPERERGRKVAEREFYGYAEAAELLGVKAKSLREYKARGVMPDPDLVISGAPAWRKITLTRWDALRKTRNASHRHEPVDWSAVGF